MVTGEIYGRRVRMQGSVWAMAAYRREFGSDMLSDALAIYRAGEADVCGLLQLAWAMARSADDSVPRYEQWLREFDPRLFAIGDTAGAVGVIDSAVSAELFRDRQAGWAVRARRWAGRRLGSLARRIGARADRLLAR